MNRENFLKSIPWIGTAADIVGSIIQSRRDRKAYQRMLEYNSPKEQMKRYQEAGLSPYLIYNSLNAGNASSPQPTTAYDTGAISQGLGNYLSTQQINQSIANQREQERGTFLDNKYKARSLDDRVSIQKFINQIKDQEGVKRSLEILDNYPDFDWSDYSKGGYQPSMQNSFKRQKNQLELATSEANIKRILANTEGMTSENVVKALKAYYADEWGMYGDWTPALGAGQKLLSFFKGARKAPIRKTIINNKQRRTLQNFNYKN